MTTNVEQKSRVYEILKEFSTAMFVSIGASGNLDARPMHVARAADGSDVWFLTGQGGSLAREVRENESALLVFQNDTSAYLTLRGRARVVQDRAKIRDLWQEAYKVWFPKGADDPEIALVAVVPEQAEYWDNRGSNKIEYMFESAKAYLKGETPKVDKDQHSKVTL